MSPAIAATALSKTVLEILFRPRMSITVCITSMSLVPTSGPNSCRPDAIGDRTIFGTPMGNVISAPADITEPSAPPIPMAPRTSPFEYRSCTLSITNLRICSTALPLVPEFCNS